MKCAVCFAPSLLLLLVCTLSVCVGADANTVELAGATNIPTAIDGVPIPRLRPISRNDANALLRYVRELQHPFGMVPWSAVFSGCPYRSFLKYWAIATSPNRTLKATDRPVLTKTSFTEAEIKKLATMATRDVAVISVGAELGTHLRWIFPNGTDTPLTYDLGWSDHYSVVINVEGTIKVVDLSVGDTPVDIQEWFHGFVPARHKYCWHMNDTEFDKVWLFWLMATVGNILQEWPHEDRQCGYSIKLLTEASGVNVVANNVIGNLPSAALLEMYSKAFPNAPLPTDQELAHYRLHYNAMTREEICDPSFLGGSSRSFVYCPSSSTGKAPPPCTSSPCANGGTCTDLAFGAGEQFSCSCPDGFTGEMCQDVEGKLAHNSLADISTTSGYSLMIGLVVVVIVALAAVAVSIYMCARRKRQHMAVGQPSVEFLMLADRAH